MSAHPRDLSVDLHRAPRDPRWVERGFDAHGAVPTLLLPAWPARPADKATADHHAARFRSLGASGTRLARAAAVLGRLCERRHHYPTAALAVAAWGGGGSGRAHAGNCAPRRGFPGLAANGTGGARPAQERVAGGTSACAECAWWTAGCADWAGDQRKTGRGRRRANPGAFPQHRAVATAAAGRHLGGSGTGCLCS